MIAPLSPKLRLTILDRGNYPVTLAIDNVLDPHAFDRVNPGSLVAQLPESTVVLRPGIPFDVIAGRHLISAVRELCKRSILASADCWVVCRVYDRGTTVCYTTARLLS